VSPVSTDSVSTYTKHLSFWHSEDRASWYILIIKANEMHYFSNLFFILIKNFFIKINLINSASLWLLL
jgi:hypothetical protein